MTLEQLANHCKRALNQGRDEISINVDCDSYPGESVRLDQGGTAPCPMGDVVGYVDGVATAFFECVDVAAWCSDRIGRPIASDGYVQPVQDHGVRQCLSCGRDYVAKAPSNLYCKDTACSLERAKIRAQLSRDRLVALSEKLAADSVAVEG